MRWTLLLLIAAAVFAAHESPEMLLAAKRGQTAKVAALIAKGGSVESTDRDERTPLMLAAMHGHAAVVEVLLKSGANPEARDRFGYTAYGLAVLSSSDGREAVLKALPQHPPLRLTVETAWTPENLVTSCFLRPAQLRDQIAAVQPEAQAAAAVRDYAVLNGRRVLEFLAEGGDGALRLTVRPGVSCVQQQSADNVTELIAVRLTAADGSVILEKIIGGGLKGLHARTVTSPAQYGVTFEEWAKAHAGEIYNAVLEAWLRRR
jgi:hypothetical protein